MSWRSPLTLVFMLCAGASCIGNIDAVPAGEPTTEPTARPPSSPRPPGDGAAATAPPGATNPGGMTPGATGPAATVAPARLRRLTRAEIENTISDVLLAGGAFASSLPDEQTRHGFDNVIDALEPSLEFVENMQATAEKAGALASGRLADLLPCAATAADRACAVDYIVRHGRRLYRRALTARERDDLTLVFTAARGRGSFPDAIAVVTEAMLQSPAFLFRTELGAAPAAGRVRLTDVELASALSYGLQRTAPDETLLAAAERGELRSDAGLRAAAERLMDTARGRQTLRSVYLEWLEIARLPLLSKADPAFDGAVGTAMLDQAGRFVDRVLASPRGTLAALLTSNEYFLTAKTAPLLGEIATPEGQVSPVANRSGLLTLPAFLTAQSSPSAFNPIFPGLFVRRKLLCQDLSNPPADIPAPSKDPGMSTREKYARHADSPACRGCHVLIDPIGFGFERYDAIGRYRTSERLPTRDVPLTAEGELSATDVDGTFVGIPALAERLAASAQVRTCHASQLLGYLVGRDASLPESRTGADQRAIAAALAGANQSVRELLLRLVVSEAFTTRDSQGLPAGGGI